MKTSFTNQAAMAICVGESGVTRTRSKKKGLLVGFFKRINPFARPSGGNVAEPYQPSNPYEINEEARRRMTDEDIFKLVRLNITGFAHRAFGDRRFAEIADECNWDFNGPNEGTVSWKGAKIQFAESGRASSQMHLILKDSDAHRKAKSQPGVNSFSYLKLAEIAEGLNRRIPEIHVTVELLINPNKFTPEFRKRFETQNGGNNNVLVA